MKYRVIFIFLLQQIWISIWLFYLRNIMLLGTSVHAACIEFNDIPKQICFAHRRTTAHSSPFEYESASRQMFVYL